MAPSLAVLIPVLAVLGTVGMTPVATAGEGCVTEREYVRVHQDMRKARVHKIFGTAGRFEDGGAGGYSRSYERCSAASRVYVEYGVADPLGSGVARVSSKWWRSSGTRDLRVIDKDSHRNSVDLVDRPVRRDHVHLRGGDDYLTMESDGRRDVIRCGGGDDLVQYADRREKKDVYRNCETVELYSP